VKVLSLIISGYVLNQSWGHWLFLDALQFVILTCWDIHEDLAFQPIPNNLVEEFFFYHKLKELVVHMKQQILEVLLPFFSLLTCISYENRP